MKKIVVLLLLFSWSCSSGTVYNIDIDLLSFFDELETEQAIVFPASTDIDIFLFPGIELDINNSGPGIESQQGILLNFPSREIKDLDTLSVKLELGVEITNNSQTEEINGNRISIFIATPDTGNIYTDGLSVDLIIINSIPPTESTVFSQEFYLEEDETLLEILRTGEFRIGMGIYLTASSSYLPAAFRLDHIRLSTRFTPVEILMYSEVFNTAD